jgi:colanic acid biosynthesis glycosyl transferase WcaI
MLASARPVLATAAPGTQIARTIGNAGVVVPPGDVAGFVDALTGMIGDRERSAAMGEQARRTAAGFHRDRVLRRLEARLAQLGAARGPGAGRLSRSAAREGAADELGGLAAPLAAEPRPRELEGRVR